MMSGLGNWWAWRPSAEACYLDTIQAGAQKVSEESHIWVEADCWRIISTFARGKAKEDYRTMLECQWPYCRAMQRFLIYDKASSYARETLSIAN